jgi:CheY-like chemotaxis protein
MFSSSPKLRSDDRVLVIDDSDIAREHIVNLLSAADYKVFDQPSAIGATRAIREHMIRAVVVDVSMPGLSGDKLVGVLRKNVRLSGLVIVVVSAKTTEELDEIDELRAADAVISKDSLDLRLVPTLSRLLKLSAFRPSSAFATRED